MATIDIKFKFIDTDGNDYEHYEEFEVESGLLASIEEFGEDYVHDDPDEISEFTDWSVYDYDSDFMDPESFTDLDEYAEYVGKCEKHGEAYRLRYEDIGDHDFEEEYNGCWGNEEEFVENLIEERSRYEECYDINIPSFLHIDWERTTRDVMMDYSSYDGSEGCHIFRNC